MLHGIIERPNLLSTTFQKFVALTVQGKVIIYYAGAESYILLSISMKNTTIVTGIWDLNRGALDEGWARNFQHYIDNFTTLLQNLNDTNLIVFIDPQYEDLVWKYRNESNTRVYHHKKEDFGGGFFPFFDKVQQIRNNDQWKNSTGWLKDSTQARMEFYNPMVMSKMFLLHNAKVFNPFNTEYMFWLDGGITNTVHPGYFSHDKVIDKIESIVNKFLFICFPYETNSEIHGFDINGMKKYAKSDTVNRVARGGFFGGHVDYITKANELYYGLLRDTLEDGYMGTEESIFTLMTYLEPDSYIFEMINNDGLISTFFEKVKNQKIDFIKESISSNPRKQHNNNDVILYLNTFNSPEQLEMVLDSFEKYDTNFLTKTKKVLINNSTDELTSEKYDNICKKYAFSEQIKQGNMGVCGARQFCAEHFDRLGSKYMMFFEDDMLLDLSDTRCSFGFNKNINNLYNTLLRLMTIEQYDFLKFSFSEFYGHNGEQWSWHNLPSNKRVEYFKQTNKRPNTKFTHIKTISGTPYAEGEIYYSNWPHIIDQEGNQKLFLDTKWEHPFEQTWMSHIYTLTVENKVRPGILLASPITHNRVHFYDGKQRREN